MTSRKDLEALVTRNLAASGLAPVPGQFAFAHKGQAVALTLDESPYTGYFLTVHDRGRAVRQFRPRAGHYDWGIIAAIIVEIAESRVQHRQAWTSPEGVRENNRRIAEELTTITGAGPESRLSIEPSSAVPGKVRVKLSEIELDPVSVMRLYAAVSHVLPPAKRKPAPG